ncbi:Hypothetical protein NocV09_03000460 [Nannochloropsis oceanica]
MAPAKKTATAAQGEIDDEQRLQSLYYRAVFKKRKVTLFTRTHYKILQALYSSSSSFSSLPPRSSSITTIWPLIESFLKDQRELMSQQAYLDRVYAAAPWLVPSPAATIANAPSSSSSSSLGWRVTRRLLHEQLIHEEDRYNQQCRRHHPLLMAIGNEIRRLSPSPASGDAAAGAGSLRNASGTAGSARHHPLLRAASKQVHLQQQSQGFASAEPSTPHYDDVPPVTFEDVSTAMFRIRNGIIRTPCYKSHFLSDLCKTKLFFKTEYSQFTGSFKERGARNALLLLTDEEKKRGVMAASAGNHALALSWHGAQLGIPVSVFMPVVAPLAKVDKCRKFGANVIITGQHIGEAKDYALSNPDYQGVKYINGYDDPEIVAGAGTIGIEVLEQISK